MRGATQQKYGKYLLNSRTWDQEAFEMTKEFRALGASDNSPEWFYPEWAANAPNNQPLVVRVRIVHWVVITCKPKRLV